MVDQRIDKLNRDIHELVKKTTIEFMATPTGTLADTVELMLAMSHTVAMNYISSLCATIGALAQMRNEKGGRRITAKMLRDLIDEELDNLVGFAEHKLIETLNEVDASDVFDPNRRLREEILETINAKS